jgi:hypothetical protein
VQKRAGQIPARTFLKIVHVEFQPTAYAYQFEAHTCPTENWSADSWANAASPNVELMHHEDKVGHGIGANTDPAANLSRCMSSAYCGRGEIKSVRRAAPLLFTQGALDAAALVAITVLTAGRPRSAMNSKMPSRKPRRIQRSAAPEGAGGSNAMQAQHLRPSAGRMPPVNGSGSRSSSRANG